jgi:hypothetical protein
MGVLALDRNDHDQWAKTYSNMPRAREFVEIRKHAPSGWQQRGSGLICGESSTVPNVARPRTRQRPRQLGGLECFQRGTHHLLYSSTQSC